jgi:hypothetical protein
MFDGYFEDGHRERVQDANTVARWQWLACFSTSPFPKWPSSARHIARFAVDSNYLPSYSLTFFLLAAEVSRADTSTSHGLTTTDGLFCTRPHANASCSPVSSTSLIIRSSHSFSSKRFFYFLTEVRALYYISRVRLLKSIKSRILSAKSPMVLRSASYSSRFSSSTPFNA